MKEIGLFLLRIVLVGFILGLIFSALAEFFEYGNDIFQVLMLISTSIFAYFEIRRVKRLNKS